MKVLMVALVCGACGTDTIQIPITVPGRPALFMGRTAGDSWHSFAGEPGNRSTSYTIDVDRDFELAMVCIHSNRAAVVGELFGTYDDANITIASWRMPDCTETAPETGPTIEVSGMLDASGQVAIGDQNLYVNTGEAFDLPVARGLHDIVVQSSDYVILIQHDVELSDGQFLGRVPVNAQGTALISKSFTLPIDDNEHPPVITTSLVTRNGTQFEWTAQPLDAAVFVPHEQRGADDTETFDVGIYSAEGVRLGRLGQFDEVPNDFVLLPQVKPFRPYADGSIAATWTPPDEFYTTAQFSVTPQHDATAGHVNEKQVTASKLWLERYAMTTPRTTALIFDDQFPGFLAEWSFEPTNWQFSDRRWSPGQIVESQLDLECPKHDDVCQFATPNVPSPP